VRGEFMEKVGLVLEGGGMRGVYTSAVLEYFMEKKLYFPYVIGVSAGACNALSYISRQKGRNKKATIGSVSDPRYINYKNLITHGYLMHMDLIFDEIPNRLIPFNYDAFFKSEQQCVIGTTSCKTGEPVYFYKENIKDLMKICRASSSLPFISPIVEVDGEPYLDGALTDSIPIKKSIEDGNDKNVVVLTRNKGYRKEPSRVKWLAKRFYPKYPKLQEVIIKRYMMYNDTLDYIDELEKKNKVFVIRPSDLLDIGRAEKNVEKLTELYNLGYKDIKDKYNALMKWVNS
jgi:predicted patatin/cPLA2 family phospholipase